MDHPAARARVRGLIACRKLKKAKNKLTMTLFLADCAMQAAWRGLHGGRNRRVPPQCSWQAEAQRMLCAWLIFLHKNILNDQFVTGSPDSFLMRLWRCARKMAFCRSYSLSLMLGHCNNVRWGK